MRHGWRGVWAVDHLVVGHAQERDYGWTLETMVSLAYLGALYPKIGLAAGVLIPPMRDAVQLAKEIATLDVLTGGRVLIGVGVGDEEDLVEYANLGKEARFRQRGAYLDESIALWRHLWSGSREPFNGKFHHLEDFVFEPLPTERDRLRVISGGRSDRALTRVGRITDGFYASRWGPTEIAQRWPGMLETARTNGRVRPYLAARVRVRFGPQPPTPGVYVMGGEAPAMIAELRRFADVGTDEFVAVFDAVTPEDVTRAADRFQHDVVAPLRAG